MEQGEPTVEVREITPPEEESRPYRFWSTDVVRASLAFLFAAFLLIVIVWGFRNAGRSQAVWGQTKELLELLLPAITALLGSAVGFYFGTQKVQ
jgi:heme/copper-type cytochrome/quinol oxidase subunit 2